MAGEFVRREVGAAPPGLGGRRRGPAVPAPRGREAGAARRLVPASPWVARAATCCDTIAVQEAMFEAGASSGLMAALFTRSRSRPLRLHRRDRAAAHRGLRQPRPRRPVRASHAGRREDRRPGDHRARRRLRRRGHPHDGPPGRRRYVVDGTKTFITSGVRADFVTVAVRTGGPGADASPLLVVEKGTAGFTVDRALPKMGWHCSDTAELGFARAGSPVANLRRAEDRLRADRRAVRGRADRPRRALRGDAAAVRRRLAPASSTRRSPSRWTTSSTGSGWRPTASCVGRLSRSPRIPLDVYHAWNNTTRRW